MEENKKDLGSENESLTEDTGTSVPAAPHSEDMSSDAILLSELSDEVIKPHISEDPHFRRIMLFLSTALLVIACIRVVGMLFPIPYLFSLLSHAALLLLFVFYKKELCPQIETRYFFRSPRRVRRILYAFPPLLFGVMALSLLGFLFSSIGKEIAFHPTSENPIFMLFFSILLPTVTEELFCRGIVLRSLRSYGNTTAVVLSSFVFAFLHSDPFDILYAFCAGIILGSVTLYTHSVIPSMFLHFAINATSGFFLYLPSSAFLPVYLTVMALALAFSLCFYKRALRPWRHIRKDSGNISARENVKTALLSPLGAVFLMLLVFSFMLWL